MSAAVIRALAKQSGETNGSDGRSQQQRGKINAPVNDPNSANANGMTPLMRAAGDGLVDFAEVLLDRGADVNAKRNDGFSALALAAFFGHSDVVRLLLERGANLQTTARYGTSAEMWADARGFFGTGNLLRAARTGKKKNEFAPRAAVVQTHTHFQRALANEMREEPEIAQEQLEKSDAPLEATPVKTLEAEKIGAGTREVVSADVGEIAIATGLNVAQPKPGAARTLPEILDTPSIIASEFHPGLVFVARISSSWKYLAVLAMIGLFAAGIVAVAFPQLVPVLNGAHREAATTITNIPGTSNGEIAKPAQSASNQIEPPAAPGESGTVSPAKAVVETPGDSKSFEATRQSESEVQQKSSTGAAKIANAESRTEPKSVNRTSGSLVNNPRSPVATTSPRTATSITKRDAVLGTGKPRQPSIDPALEPAPLSVEASRSRTVFSPALPANERKDDSTPTVITPNRSKTKVIPWP
ncbi:MAG: ankyrin repeat domain-containing protein [Acidobacteriota bacterium]